MSIAIDKLVNDDRFSGDNLLQFLIYLPIGLFILLLRIILCGVLWLISSVLPDKLSTRHIVSSVACFTFGTYVKHKGSRDSKTTLLIANCVSALDCLAVSFATGSISPRKWKLRPFLSSALGIEYTDQLTNKHDLSPPSTCVLLQPEEIPTNGRGLLKFKEWAFQSCNQIQPVAITVSRPFTNVTVHTSGDSPDRVSWSDMLWFMWMPCTTYTVTLLPSVERQAGDTDEQFTEQVQKVIAEHLKIPSTQHMWEDVLELVKRREREYRTGRRPQPGTASAQTGSEMSRMGQQVKEVLPRVPMADILKDLARTRSVDVTITNFLEEIIPYTPESVTTDLSSPSSSASSPLNPVPATAMIFSKNAEERQMSFHERKNALIASARKRYIEKHGLNAALNNC